MWYRHRYASRFAPEDPALLCRRPRSPSPRPRSKIIDPIPTEVILEAFETIYVFFGNLMHGTAEINASTGSARARAVFPLLFR